VLKVATADHFPYRGAYGTGGPYWRWLGSVAERYDRFLDFISQNRSAMVFTYEEMVLQFRVWLERFCYGFEVSDSRFIDTLHAKHRFDPAPVENQRHHRRQVRPEDHRSKLSRDTIAALNSIFDRYLRWACERPATMAATSLEAIP
jgi:hypothetical protein